ncbi:hypothetical protein FVEG_16383 [Fusarium verticillioides 7600]|uniref:Uncharacterized protein n=1 Tax=Gibberella moniliformis (strain M3125 / FGSC 7600) TaxID=334819 RepID=W7MBY6_GIBM7|nr:hypothetical protein FVEG_16383 [Fusarium verticillioides 7600]EWG49008.1 hypothetical protein FVEG_16383 [Fusarium verticillioides 7600]RBQ74399.1 hypothetical protein FVER14953_20347 [Fusarium verticillioides]
MAPIFAAAWADCSTSVRSSALAAVVRRASNVSLSAGQIMGKYTCGGVAQGAKNAYGNGYLSVHIRKP